MKKLTPITVPKKVDEREENQKLIMEVPAELLPANHPKKALLIDKAKK